MSLNPITHPLLTKAGVRHGFFTRAGGVSDGIYAGLNAGVGSKDDPAHVAENRRRVAEWMGGGADDLCGCYQVHSAVARVAESGWAGDRPEGDAVVAGVKGPVLTVLTADCAPVLFADAEAGVVGAAHAGWKGALTGVLDSVLLTMEQLGAQRERISAAIGPCISRRSYEVDEAFLRRFAESCEEAEHFFSSGTREGHYQFDLEGFITLRLAQAGVRDIEALGEDTYAQPERFFSYRRATHAGEPDYGRQISLIALPG